MADEFASVTDPRLARLLLHPLRRQVLAHADKPTSAAQIADKLQLPRQQVNYHVRVLADAGFLKPAGEVKRRGATERLYVAVSRGYMLSPDLLGDIQIEPGEVGERASAEYLMAIATRAQVETARARAQAEDGADVGALALHADIRFRTSAEREAFTRALRASVLDLVARHGAPASDAARSKMFRLAMLVHPAVERAP